VSETPPPRIWYRIEVCEQDETGQIVWRDVFAGARLPAKWIVEHNLRVLRKRHPDRRYRAILGRAIEKPEPESKTPAAGEPGAGVC
jgi:hypothetical protein